ncbi:MAG: hypothetical protein KKB81_06210 [Candidatus Margulisbacteria bacterium]|nr:hypothetical protein [Candidatus Margulisiibacteriota bacterium]MBU1021449.1 hypothetical protein [Candidatus Margulisiibacteriota bacterium]MBU1728370.1 hypothetical protein [Candidatus Margulisiibacteriota bacterium]MBU1955887.1 hypothetical protein [Candidatus Margulisiibacteriota bacterium]
MKKLIALILVALFVVSLSTSVFAIMPGGKDLGEKDKRCIVGDPGGWDGGFSDDEDDDDDQETGYHTHLSNEVNRLLPAPPPMHCW